MSDVPLAGAIRQLRAELTEAMRQGKDEELRFALGDIELELQLEVSKEAKGDAGIRFWLVSLGASASASRASTHVMRLTLTPETTEGTRPRVSR
jgi:Trypsin-co-occurring domain 2